MYLLWMLQESRPNPAIATISLSRRSNDAVLCWLTHALLGAAPGGGDPRAVRVCIRLHDQVIMKGSEVIDVAYCRTTHWRVASESDQLDSLQTQDPVLSWPPSVITIAHPDAAAGGTPHGKAPVSRFETPLLQVLFGLWLGPTNTEVQTSSPPRSPA